MRRVGSDSTEIRTPVHREGGREGGGRGRKGGKMGERVGRDGMEGGSGGWEGKE